LLVGPELKIEFLDRDLSQLNGHRLARSPRNSGATCPARAARLGSLIVGYAPLRTSREACTAL
jgi:hypothetical protein